MATPAPLLNHHHRPYAWPELDAETLDTGAVIAKGFCTPGQVETVNAQLDAYLAEHEGAADAATGSADYDRFLGHKTLRLHGLVEKIPATRALIGSPELIEWAERLLAPVASSVLMNAGELIQIQPGEPKQYPHRDSDSWIAVPVSEVPIIVNALVALDPCTLENGATYAAPNSWTWEPGRKPKPEDYARAVMEPGDALMFRGDIIHGGGENDSAERRRILSISYCAGWLRPVENSYLNINQALLSELPERLQGVLGYHMHDGLDIGGGLVGLYENGDPRRWLAELR